jgi:hypothetical protein
MNGVWTGVKLGCIATGVLFALEGGRGNSTREARLAALVVFLGVGWAASELTPRTRPAAPPPAPAPDRGPERVRLTALPPNEGPPAWWPKRGHTT